jgi:hypothetical protein
MTLDDITTLSGIFTITWRLPAVMWLWCGSGVALLLFPAERPFNRIYALISFVRERPYPVSSDRQAVF